MVALRPVIAPAAIWITSFAIAFGACGATETTVQPDAAILADAQPEDAPPATGGPHARPVSSTLIEVVWAANSETDLAGYKIYRDGVVVALIRGDMTSYSDRNVLPATTYTYSVTAFDLAGNESQQTPPLRATTPPGTLPNQSFQADVFPILESKCSSCHAAYSAPMTAYTRLTSVGSGPCAGQLLVVTGNSAKSLLYQIVTGSQDCAQPLPSGPLPSAQASVVGAWINQGGLDN